MKALLIDAVVSAGERPVLVEMESQLRECLAGAAGEPWNVRVRERESLGHIDATERPGVVVTSLLRDLASNAPMPEIAARWRSDIAALGAQPPPVLVCTLFRHVDDVSLRARLRRLNLMAIELSHDTRIGVVDIDRAFAQQGARALAADYRLAGRLAAAAAAHTIVTSLLRMGLDDLIPHDVQERAQEIHGDLRDIGKRVDAATFPHAS